MSSPWLLLTRRDRQESCDIVPRRTWVDGLPKNILRCSDRSGDIIDGEARASLHEGRLETWARDLASERLGE